MKSASKSRFLLENDEHIVAYLRSCARQTLLVVANVSGETAEFNIPEELLENKWNRRLTNKKDTAPSLDGNRNLSPWEVEIYELAR